MAIISSFVGPLHPLWCNALKLCRHDVYHLPAYVQLEAQWSNSLPLAFYFQYNSQIMLLPLLQRETPSGLCADAVTPYGYSCPIFSDNVDSQFISLSLSEFNRCAIDKGLICTFIRLHPSLCTSLLPYMESFSFCMQEKELGSTVTMPLSGEYDQWLQSLGKSFRYDIIRLQKKGCCFSFDSDILWDHFPEIYSETMRRLNAKSRYLYTKEYFDSFRDAFGDSVICAGVLSLEGEIMAVALFTNVCGNLQYLFSGTSQSYLHYSPTKYLLARMREVARGMQVEYFNLGGGVGSCDDGLFAFKRRFGGDVTPFRAVSIVHDQNQYNLELKAVGASIPPVGSSYAGFFPAYRR